MNIDIGQYENSDALPWSKNYPNTPWTHEATNGQKYNGAFDVAEDDQESADIYLWMLVGHRLRYDRANDIQDGRVVGIRSLTWREAFERERDALAWRAFAKDIGDFELHSMVDGVRVERTVNRDKVAKLFKAFLPESVTGSKDKDILERTHIKREKDARRKGETYWRKNHQPEAQAVTTDQSQQPGLF